MAPRLTEAPRRKGGRELASGLAEFFFGKRGLRRMPARVGRAIAGQQVQSEILVSWVQFGLIAFFIALYAIAPKTSAGTPFTPVPYVLAAYLGFTLVRLVLANRGSLPGWLLFGSVIVDIGLLLGLIWSFHLQYGQPPSFYLKAPTLLYVFIFIALRTLRFDPVYVVACGLAAAFGWLFLLWYALAHDGNVTRDYVSYLTSNHILIGGEVDKIIAILLVTAILAVSLVRARRLLVRAVTDATVARDLTRFVAPEVAQRIAGADRGIEPGDGEVTHATILFCDIERFSTIAEGLSPTALMATLNDYFAAVVAIVDAHAGVITMFQGDAMLITFNSARSNPDHAACALRTALAIQDLSRSTPFGPEGLVLRTRCGLNTGACVSGAVGAPERLYFTVYGDEVNIAARLEQLNKEHGTYVLVSESCIAEAGDGFPCRPIGAVQVRGRSRPVSVFALDPQALAPEPTVMRE
ncbi:MAG: adenylate/guanylate cyclase domain-containing protein [Rhodospirillales bacterium]